MAFKITIRNLDENSFNLNGGKTLTKGVYVIVLKPGDKLGLENKNTHRLLMHPTHFKFWEKHSGEQFTSLADLVKYMQDYIELKGKAPATQQSNDVDQKILNNLITLNTKFDLLIEAINNNTAAL